ncbi:MAG: tetratricopeptide repeat protein [Alphaproteobacteria bacterium]|nr:tetratricopeptide repeat protein [Alphaproteobacteria bacterium]
MEFPMLTASEESASRRTPLPLPRPPNPIAARRYWYCLAIAGILTVCIGSVRLVALENGWQAYLKGDYATALTDFRFNAQRGDVTAEYNLGVMYETGQGVAQDDVEAFIWYSRAAEHFPEGDARKRASRRRGAVKRFMTNEERSDAMTRAKRQGLDYRDLKDAQVAIRSNNDRPTSTNVVPGRKPKRDRDISISSGRVQYALHLSSVKSRHDTAKEWARLSKANGELLSDMRLHVRQVSTESRGIFYRVLAGSLANRSKAENLCARIRVNKQYCLAIRLNGN